MKETSLIIKICDWVTKYSIYALVFLLPVLFLPWTSEVLDFNKQTLLIGLVIISLFSWMLKVLISGKLEINMNKIHIFAGVFFSVYLLTIIFSADKYGSFWGWPLITSESFLSIIGLVLFYFLVSNALAKKDIIKSLFIFSVSALVVEIFGVFQLFGWFIFPFDFAKNIGFNSIGGAGGLGVFAAVLFPLMFVSLIKAQKWTKALFIVAIILSGLIFFLVNYPLIWWTVIFGSASILIIGFLKRNIFDARWMALPIFFMVVSLAFIILNPQINWLAQKSNEISLSHSANFQIDLQVLKEKPIFGSGPGTFTYDFSKFKNESLNKTVLWNVAFNSGSSKVLTSLATTGVLGVLALLALMASVIFYAVKFLVIKKNDSDQDISFSILGVGLFASFIAGIASYFLHSSNLTLDFLFFFIIAILVGLIFENRKEYKLKSSSSLTLAVTFVFTLVFIFGLGFLILDSQRYVAEATYYSGLKSLQAGDIDGGTKKLEAAASINPGADLYFRQLAQIYLFKIQSVLTDPNKSQDAKSKAAQTLVANSVNAAKIATDNNPESSGNWLIRGYVYQSLTGLVTDSNTWAINSYNEAVKLDPNNPYALTQRGIVYYQDKDYQNAKANFDQALNLKPDYSNALYFSGLIFDQAGQKDKAIEQFTKLAQLNPASATDIQKIIDNLKAGKGALDGLTQGAPVSEAPVVTTPSQTTNPPAESQP